MGFLAFAGRFLFSVMFILSASQKIYDFGHDGGAALNILTPKYGVFANHVRTILGVQLPEIELIFLAAVTPIVHDFYNYDMRRPEYVVEFIQFLKNLALFGVLLFFLGMKKSLIKKPKKKAIKLKGN